MSVNVLILFIDARGFTSWANRPEVFDRLDDCSRTFTEVLRAAFPPKEFFHKGLGDGAMIVRELKGKGKLDPRTTARLLRETLEQISAAEEAFATACRDFAHQIGGPANLRLGWGVARGSAQRLKDPVDYVGPSINKCARLCSIARPFGIVIDQEDFPDAPEFGDYKFYPQVRRLTGIEEGVSVWVTQEIAAEFLTREKLRQTPEVHVAGQCLDASSKKGLKILIAKRSPLRTFYPDLYEGCGGQLAASETFPEGVVRHFRLEMRIDVRVFEDLHCFYEIRERDHPLIPGIRFLCEQVGEQEPRSLNHTEVRWVSEKEFRTIPADQFVPQLKEQVLELIERDRGR